VSRGPWRTCPTGASGGSLNKNQHHHADKARYLSHPQAHDPPAMPATNTIAVRTANLGAHKLYLYWDIRARRRRRRGIALHHEASRPLTQLLMIRCISCSSGGGGSSSSSNSNSSSSPRSVSYSFAPCPVLSRVFASPSPSILATSLSLCSAVSPLYLRCVSPASAPYHLISYLLRPNTPQIPSSASFAEKV
jgi:hypothetical protein